MSTIIRICILTAIGIMLQCITFMAYAQNSGGACITSRTYTTSDASGYIVQKEYDNGNMKKDRNKGISSITCNTLNLPSRIEYENGSRATYLYSADGTKLQVQYETSYSGLLASGPPSGSASTAIADIHTIDYVGNKIYEDGVLSRILVEGGYVDYNGGTPIYHAYLTDHQGNVRVVVDENAAVKQVNHYYPYGALFAESTNGDVQPYKYNGKELDRMHGLDWYDHGARHNDAAIGRWHVMDPLCEKYYDVSPYAYCNGNPINQFDPDGRAIETVWDIGNVVYDVGAALYNHVKGDHETAKSHWVDAGLDAVASLAPFIPAGSSKLFRGGGNAVKAFQSNIKTGKKFEKAVVEEAKKEGRNISTQITVVPQNGIGNIKGNRSIIDMLEKKKDGAYSVTEIKLSPKSRPSRGQKAVEKHIKNGNKRFEIRSNKSGFHKGDIITINDHQYKYKNQ